MEPAPTMVCNSSMNRIICPSDCFTSRRTAFRRSSNHPTILSASEHRRKVKRNKLTIFQAGGNVARNDALGQAFNDCRFAHARLANKHRVVLRTTGKNLNGTTNFLGTTDYRIEFAITCLLSKVLAILPSTSNSVSTPRSVRE